MQQFEYKVVPAPRRGEKQRGLKTTEDRFAYALSQCLNDLGADGWEYLRAEALPVDERSGFTGIKTTEHHVLIFRRARAVASVAPQAPVVSVTAAALGAETPAVVRLGAPKKAPTASKRAPSLGPATSDEV